MNCYEKFPLSTVLYNGVTIGGAAVIGVIIAAQFGVGAVIGYLVLLVLTLIRLLATVCARCSYYGHRCAVGVGKLVGLLFKKGREDEFAETTSQLLSIGLLLVFLLVLPVAGGVNLLIRQFTQWRLVQLVALVGLLLAALIPHPYLVCCYCRQREQGACSIGCMLWKGG